MENKKLGQEPAFASQSQSTNGNNINTRIQTGMSKRLYIATKAMQGILSNSELRHDILMDSKQSGTNPKKLTSDEYLAKTAYEFADAILKQENDA